MLNPFGSILSNNAAQLAQQQMWDREMFKQRVAYDMRVYALMEACRKKHGASFIELRNGAPVILRNSSVPKVRKP